MASTLKGWWKTFEKYPKVCWGFSLAWLLIVGFLAFIWDLGNTGLVDETEPLFAEAARQMTVTGDWITPYFNGATRFDKPPLIYWLMAIGYKLIGVNEWAVRLPSALAAIALMVCGFYTLRHFGFATPGAAQTPEKSHIQRQLWLSAWLGVAIMALNSQMIIWGRTGVSDMLLNGCMGSALFCFFIGYTKTEKSQENNIKNTWLFPNLGYLGFYICSSLAVLTKGPVGIVLPGFIIVAFLFYLGKLKEVLQEMKIPIGIIIFLGITLPWYILVTLQNGDAFINAFFGYHNFDRFTSVVNGHQGVWYFYFLIVLGLFAPWSSYLPLAIARLRFWKQSFWRQQPRQAQLSLFALFWFVGIFGFFTVAVTKLPSYTLPLIPAAAILVALLWSDALTQTNFSKNPQKGLFFSGIFNSVFLLLLAIAFWISPQLVGRDPAVPNLSKLLQESGLPLWGCLVWGITSGVIALFLLKKNQWPWLVIINLVGFLACLILVFIPAIFLLDQMRQLPLRQLAEVIIQVEQPGETVFMVGFEKPSLVFYTQGPVQFFDKSEMMLDALANPSKLKPKPQASTVLILSRPKDIRNIHLQPQDYQLVTQKGAYEMIRVPLEKLFKTQDFKPH